MGWARTRGLAAESLAAAYLEVVGMRVTERNRRIAGVEIDALAEEGSTRVLVEVKCRGRSDYGGAALAIGFFQRLRLLRAARALAAEDPRPVRIDVVAIEVTADGAVVRHYRGAVDESPGRGL